MPGLQMPHRLDGLALVWCAHIEYPGLTGSCKGHGAGTGGHQRYVVLGQQGQQAWACGVPTVQEQGRHMLARDEVACVLHRLGRVELVVHRNQFHRLPMHAALAVDGVEIEIGAFGVSFTPAATEPVNPDG